MRVGWAVMPCAPAPVKLSCPVRQQLLKLPAQKGVRMPSATSEVHNHNYGQLTQQRPLRICYHKKCLCPGANSLTQPPASRNPFIVPPLHMRRVLNGQTPVPKPCAEIMPTTEACLRIPTIAEPSQHARWCHCMRQPPTRARACMQAHGFANSHRAHNLGICRTCPCTARLPYLQPASLALQPRRSVPPFAARCPSKGQPPLQDMRSMRLSVGAGSSGPRPLEPVVGLVHVQGRQRA